jgi:hypothetical protein
VLQEAPQPEQSIGDIHKSHDAVVTTEDLRASEELRGHIVAPAGPTVTPQPEEGFRPLFNGNLETFSKWRLAGPADGGMRFADGEMRSYGEAHMRIFYYAAEAFADFTLRLQFKIFDATKHNSGVFVRFADPTTHLQPGLQQRVNSEPAFELDNVAWRPVISGFEVQIDDTALGDPGKDFFRCPTGAGRPV